MITWPTCWTSASNTSGSEVKVHFILNVLGESWGLLVESSIYILFGLLVAGMLKVFIDPSLVARHLGRGRFLSVLKAALFGVPIPL
jgi:uncharacterized membrane protein YraQ (UPF0718 family)